MDATAFHSVIMVFRKATAFPVIIIIVIIIIQWLLVPERVQFKIAVLTYTSLARSCTDLCRYAFIHSIASLACFPGCRPKILERPT